MPASRYQWLTFSNVDGMRNASAKSQIRTHTNKEIGLLRRRTWGRSKTRKGVLEFPLRKLSCREKRAAGGSLDESRTGENSDPCDNGNAYMSFAARSDRQLPLLVDDKALYNSSARGISSAFDPFSTASVQVDSTVNGLLQYFVFYTSSFATAWTYCASSLPHEPFAYTKAIRAAVDSALQDKLMMHCLLSAASSRLYYSERVQLPRWQEQELDSTTQALCLLRKRIKGIRGGLFSDTSSVEALVSSITHLSASAFHRGDLPTAQIHLRAALKLADRIGGLPGLKDPHVQGRLLDRDNLLSSAALHPSLVDCSSYDPGPVSEVFGRGMLDGLQSEHDLVATGLISSRDSNTFLPEPMKILILQLVECHRLRLYVRRQSLSCSFKMVDGVAIRNYQTMRILAIRSRLLALRTTEYQDSALRVALIMYTLLPTTKDLKKHARVVQALAPKLKGFLSVGASCTRTSSERSCDVADADGWYQVRLWMLLLGYFCSAEPSDTLDWFGNEIRKTLEHYLSGISRSCNQADFIGKAEAEKSRSRLLTALIALQRQFFYDDGVLRPATEKLAEWLLWHDTRPVASLDLGSGLST